MHAEPRLLIVLFGAWRVLRLQVHTEPCLLIVLIGAWRVFCLQVHVEPRLLIMLCLDNLHTCLLFCLSMYLEPRLLIVLCLGTRHVRLLSSQVLQVNHPAVSGVIRRSRRYPHVRTQLASERNHGKLKA